MQIKGETIYISLVHDRLPQLYIELKGKSRKLKCSDIRMTCKNGLLIRDVLFTRLYLKPARQIGHLLKCIVFVCFASMLHSKTVEHIVDSTKWSMCQTPQLLWVLWPAHWGVCVLGSSSEQKTPEDLVSSLNIPFCTMKYELWIYIVSPTWTI